MSQSESNQKTFEELLRDLTTVVEQLEKGNLPLETSVALYEKGLRLLQQAREILDSAQARLEELLSVSDDGVQTRALDPEQFIREG